MCDPLLGIVSSARKAMGVRGDEKEKGAGKAGIINKWVVICQEQSKQGGSYVMMIPQGELEDHELIRPLISEAGASVIKFKVGQNEWRMITNVKKISVKKSGCILEMRDMIIACIMMEGSRKGTMKV